MPKAKFDVTVKFTKEIEVDDSCNHEDADGDSTYTPNCGKEACRQNLMDKATDEVIADARVSSLFFGRGFKSTIEVDER